MNKSITSAYSGRLVGMAHIYPSPCTTVFICLYELSVSELSFKLWQIVALTSLHKKSLVYCFNLSVYLTNAFWMLSDGDDKN